MHIMKWIVIAFLTLSLNVNAQNISVTTFRLLPNDLAANTNGTEVLDQNGEKTALIKVVTTQTGFTFEAGALGITKVKQENGEVWVYIPQKSKKITIKHPQLGVLRDYFFPSPIEAARTYEMKLATGSIRTIVDEDDGKTYLAMKVSPTNAVVMIDNVLQALDSNGYLIVRIDRGEHTYNIQAAGYQSENGILTLGTEKLIKEISLKSNMVEVYLSCSTDGVQLYINDVLKGTNNWQGQLPPGNYLFEAKKEGHYSQKATYSLQEREKRNILLPKLVAQTGKLDVSYKPIGAEVWMDGRKIGTSPDIIKDIIVGNHNIEIRKLGYITKKTNIKIKESEISKLDGTLEETKTNNVEQSNIKDKGNYLTIHYDGGIYKGDVIDGKPHGKGRMTYNDKSYYDGEWSYGKKNGIGKYYNSETDVMQERFYINGVCTRITNEYVVGNRYNDSSSNTTTMYGGGSYEGQTVDGIPHGKGRMTYKDGSYYDGDWSNGIMHGKGKFYDSKNNIMQEGVYDKGICKRVLKEYKMPRK